ncbi:MAG: hypothetical protein C0514_04310 [Candidatus Puniceispirillum sp.]|nr:hypothetical protein [Candidatus Puniceispirillum sp.]
MKKQAASFVFAALFSVQNAQGSFLERMGFSSLDGEGRTLWSNAQRVQHMCTEFEVKSACYVDWSQVVGEAPNTAPLLDPTDPREVLDVCASRIVAAEYGAHHPSYGFYQKEATLAARSKTFDSGDLYAMTVLSPKAHETLLAEHGLKIFGEYNDVSLSQTTHLGFSAGMLANIVKQPCQSIGFVGAAFDSVAARDLRFRLQEKISLGQNDFPSRVVIDAPIDHIGTLDSVLEALGGTGVKSLVLRGAAFHSGGADLLGTWLEENTVSSLTLNHVALEGARSLKLIPRLSGLSHLRVRTTTPMNPGFPYGMRNALEARAQPHDWAMSFHRSGRAFEMKPRSHLAPAITLATRLLTRGRA